MAPNRLAHVQMQATDYGQIPILLSPFLFFILHNTWFSVDIRVIRVIGGKHTIRGLVQSSELYVLLAEIPRLRAFDLGAIPTSKLSPVPRYDDDVMKSSSGI